MKPKLLRLALLVAAAAALFWSGVVVGQNKYETPGSIIHVVSIKWKPDATEADRRKALDGIKEMAARIEGIKNVWIKSTRVQPSDFHAAFAIEFADKAAAERYVDHPAHKEWEKYYLEARQESRSLQITN